MPVRESEGMVIGADASRAAEGERTGTEAYSLFLLKELSKLAVAEGHRVRLYHRDQPAEELCSETAGIEHVVLSFPRMWTHLRLASELHRKPPDIFFTPAHVIPYSYHGPSVATVHDLGFLHYPEAHSRSQLRYLRWSTEHNAKRARRVIADSEATKVDLLHYYHIPAGQVEVIYPGIDPDLRPESDQGIISAVLEKYGVSAPYLLYLGTIQPRKNLIRLIDAYLGTRTEHQLVLAGKLGWLSEPIISHVEGLDADDRKRIRVPGYIAREDKNALITAAGALVFPSLYEGFGFPLIEANACGTPVLASNSSSLPEIAGDAALLVDPLSEGAIRDGIERIVSDEPLRNGLVQAGLKNARRFSWETAAEQTLAVLERAARE
jgi:glycosyltransferase involved in cell wall biosynthesis